VLMKICGYWPEKVHGFWAVSTLAHGRVCINLETSTVHIDTWNDGPQIVC
jgi:hypothetical protein